MKKRCTHILFKPISKKSGRARLTNNAAVLLLLLLLSIFTIPAWAQNTIKVTGVVKDSKGITLPGVSVKVKGTTIGSLTDIDGKYSVNAPAGATLVFSYVSYTTKEVAVAGNKVINVTLLDNTTDLNEVIVQGYGQTVKKSDLIGSIGSVSAKQIQERQPLSLLDALQGNIAGAQVVLDGGDPFSQGTVQIRGASTLNGGNGPLYVIDGNLQNDATFLNPSDIASIEVLRDAASAAIYGVRGANGVIIVTTKHGKEGKLVVGVNYYHLFGKLAHKLQTVSANDLRYYRKLRGDGLSGVNADSVNHYLNADNDYQDLLFRTANKDNINLNLSGGQKGLTYYGGLNYTNDKSIVLNSQAQTVKTVLNLDYQATDKLKITNSVNYSYQTGNSIPVGTSAKQVFERNPWTSIYKPDGTLAGYVESKRNPVAFAMYSTNVPTTFIFQDNIQASYQFFKDLRVTGSFNGRMDNIQTAQFTPSALTSTGVAPSVGSSELEKKFSYEVQLFANYNKTFGKDHAVTATLGFSRDRFRDDDFTFGLMNYLNETVFTSNVATVDLTKTNTTATYNATESMFGRAQYSYKNRYILSGTVRRDGSSRFGPDNKWGNFGSVGIAWRFSDEPFMKWAKGFLDDAKLRYSYGVLGNDKLGNDFPYATLYNFGAGSTVTNSGVYNGASGAYIATTLGNPTIHWESTATSNFGLDLTMFNGRFQITPEYYIKNTNGLLYKKLLPEETGFKDGTINLGNIQNRGVEITVSGTPIKTKNFMWTPGLNLTIQQAGVIKELAGHTPYFAANAFYIYEGGRVGDFYLYKNLGVYQYDVSNAYATDGRRLTPVGVTVNTAANTSTASGYTLDGQPYTGAVHQLTRNGLVLKGGATIWQDTNNDGIIDDNDRTIQGNSIPKVYFGFNNYFKYKQFGLSVQFNAQFGNKVYNSVANGQNTNSSTYSPPTVAAIYDSWHAQGDIATYPNFKDKDTYGSISNGTNGLYLQDGSFIRLTSLKATYELPIRLSAKVKARSLNVYVYGNNLLTWTNYSWYDPEFTATSVLVQGIDNGTYPKRREVGLGLNVQF